MNAYFKLQVKLAKHFCSTVLDDKLSNRVGTLIYWNGQDNLVNLNLKK